MVNLFFPFSHLPIETKISVKIYLIRIGYVQVPFFMDDEETPSTPKADALFIPRENPRALVIRPIEQWPPRTISECENVVKDSSAPVNENGMLCSNVII